MKLSNSNNKRIILAIVAVFIGIGIWLASNPKPPVMPFPGVTLLPKPLPLSQFELTDHQGNLFNNGNLKGKWSIMFFGYTHCPDICPTTLAMLNKFYKSLPTSGNSSAEQIIFISADPIRDTPQRMAEHVNYYNDKFIGLTTDSVETIKRFGEEVGVIFDYETPDTHELISDTASLTADSNYQVEHNASIFIVDPKGRLAADILPPHNVDRVSKTFNLLKEYY